MNALEQALKEQVDGEVHFDTIHKKIYSVDASIYEIEPIGIVLPRTKQALIDTVNIAKKFNIPIIPRGAATGITGGCLGKALIIDTSKYLNRILKINYEKEYVICEPGVVQDILNDQLAEHGYRLGPNTSTGNRATIGGMLANNAAGSRSLLYGTMAEHTMSVELLLATGELLNFHELNDIELQDKCTQNNVEGNMYREINRIRKQYRHEIEEHFPNIPRRVSGYNLNTLIKPGPLNLCSVIAGSEGSLGITTEIQLKICKKPKEVGICILHFNDMIEGMRSIEMMLQHHPIALEMIDDKIIRMGRSAPSMQGKLDWLTDNPKAVFVAEFSGDTSEEVSRKLSGFSAEMAQKNIGFAHTVLQDPLKMSHVWNIRKSGLGLLLSKRSYSRAIAFLEDISVAPAELAPFMEKFLAYLHSKGKDAGVYGHVGSGCMHIRPYIDLRSVDEVHLMEQMMFDVSDLLLEHGGALSGEHGDGLVRSWLNKKMFGERLYQAFIDLKRAFDPENRMNPGKVVHGPPFLENLRLSPNTKNLSISTFLDFSQEGGFELAADLCNGNGLCRKSEKVMCPSFQVTGDEFHTTRARAQALRSIIHKRLPINQLTSQGMHDVMDLCLQCKGCKTECPSEVDMAKMKAEFLYHYQREHGISLRTQLFANIGFINQIGSLFPTLFNFFSNRSFSKRLLNWIGITPKHRLPLITKQLFSKWFKEHIFEKNHKHVVLYNDTFTEFNHPEIGQAAVKVLESLGYQVILPKWHCCGRPALSKGLLPKAQSMAKAVIDLLIPYAERDLPIIGLEPSCLLTIKDDYSGLLGKDDPKQKKVANACITFDEFLAQHIVNNQLPLLFIAKESNIKIHGHCHQKALVGIEPSLKVLRSIPGSTVTEIQSGCCGMAGSFGYEKEHYEISQQIGELHLFPEVRATEADTLIVADGMSCRSQIAHGTERHAYHLAEVIAQLLE